MNYFELFAIPVQLKVDRQGLSRKYFELSKKFHPDYYINETPATQAAALDKAAMLNRAFKIFQNPDETIKYVLREKGLLSEDEKYELPGSFLMEMMDINEAIMEEGNLDKVKADISNLQDSIYEPVKPVIENYKDGITTTDELLMVKDYYYKKKYLHRLEQQLAGMP